MLCCVPAPRPLLQLMGPVPQSLLLNPKNTTLMELEAMQSGFGAVFCNLLHL